jgi:hypothetical protein
MENQEKSGGNFQNQLLNSGKFSSGKKFENQEIPGQIRRFGKPDLNCFHVINHSSYIVFYILVP